MTYKNGHLRVFLFEELLTYPYLLTVGVRANAFSLVVKVKISNERKSVNKLVWDLGLSESWITPYTSMESFYVSFSCFLQFKTSPVSSCLGES